MTPRPEPFFLAAEPGPLGRRFAVYHAPRQGSVLGLVVYVHPFAEEMNKSRRMAALQSRALASAGFAVLQVDLMGCGDSAGDFGEATWHGWIADVVHACKWLKHRHEIDTPDPSAPPLWLWGLRAGCLLAVQAAGRLDCLCHCVFWQPATSGKLVLQQFLRLKVAGELLAGKAKSAMDSMRAQLGASQAIDVGGYTLHPMLCHQLEGAILRLPPRPGRVEWLEVSTRDGAGLSPASAVAAEQWRQAGWSVRTHMVKGPTFWQTTEIEDAPALLAATLDAVAKPESESATIAPAAAEQ